MVLSAPESSRNPRVAPGWAARHSSVAEITSMLDPKFGPDGLILVIIATR
jgi:hypothetical protein